MKVLAVAGQLVTFSNMKALVPIADGSEEIEATSIIDTLRRAAIVVEVAAVGSNLEITASRGVKLVADRLIEDCSGPYAVIAVPGGMPGAENLAASNKLTDLLTGQAEAGRLIAAICAAPVVVLQPLGLLNARRVTAHPGFFDQLEPSLASVERVIKDGNIITSRGPGTAIEFALAIIAELLGAEQAEKIAAPMLVK